MSKLDLPSATPRGRERDAAQAFFAPVEQAPDLTGKLPRLAHGM
jgi:hypothetical protein